MPKKFICNYSKDELQKLYLSENMTIKKLCKIVGCKSDITMAKILHNYGIDTNHNKEVAFSKRGNRTDDEFYQFLTDEYITKKRSMTSIAKELGISWVIVSRYLDKYNITKRTKSEQLSGTNNPAWKNGRRKTSSGYYEVYCPNHPKANKRHCVYEHQLEAEILLGRYLAENEVVHHIDGDKTNNSLTNLLVLPKEEHTKLHIQQGNFGRKKGVV